MYRLGLTQNNMVDVRVDLEGNRYVPSPQKSITHNYKKQTLVQRSTTFHEWSGTFICDTADELNLLIDAYNQRVVWFEDQTGVGPNGPVQVLWTGGLINLEHPDELIARIPFQMSSIYAT